jgi:phage/plasmid-associated DNA primase
LGYHVDIINSGKIILVGDFRKLNLRILKPNTNDDHDLTYDFSVRNIGIGQYYGFAVDKNERYTLYNGVITYNSNGKTSVTNLVKYAFGEYYAILDHTIITRRRNNPSNASPELADKRGKRFIIMTEPESDEPVYVGFMKQLTGGDEITARALFHSPFKYKPQFKLVLMCNNLPRLSATDGGVVRRVRVIPFD